MKNPNRELWNNRHRVLRAALEETDEYEKAIELFLSQHAMVHSTEVARSEWSFDDELWQGLNEESIRYIPPGGEHSIAWCIYHIARCEDVTVNLLVAGSPQVMNKENRAERMKATIRHTGNEMGNDSIVELSNSIDINTLREYRLTVGHRTREVVQQIQPGDLKQNVDPYRIKQVWDEGAVIKAAGYIVNYWGKRTIAGLLLMPPTRHNFVHLNEALRLKQKQPRNRKKVG